MASFTFVREIAAPPETVFEVLVDHRGYSEHHAAAQVRARAGGRAGAERGRARSACSSAVGPPLREEVLTYEEPSRFSYKLLSGLPVRDHVGTVELTAAGRAAPR